MLAFRIGRVSLRLHFGFFAVMMLYLYIGGRTDAMAEQALVCCLLHELGHIIAMTAFGCPPRRISFYAFGISITPSRKGVSRGSKAVILSAGCLVNFILAAVSHIAGLDRLAEVNLSLALFNLLPLPQLDGGRLLALLRRDTAG